MKTFFLGGGLLDVPSGGVGIPNGYPPGGSPLSNAPPSPHGGGKHDNGAVSPRPNLRVVIPNNSQTPSPVPEEVSSLKIYYSVP